MIKAWNILQAFLLTKNIKADKLQKSAVENQCILRYDAASLDSPFSQDIVDKIVGKKWVKILKNSNKK
ncbi:hypothetical protein BBH51_07990 [Aggregatibacter actinomycetemcomitans]|uniref:Uncharacterized protein n=1 Tax=Aggregatibacter actinomycetemcomitans TaxID=714 RepID=A0AAC8XX05_AGGAC|nr:hypothetical protein ACT75_01650 [Aggregatibacter actinomycetemcomitans]ANN81599.1 hypothetical protein D7S_02660 [Aggregatibacter actinomycetemcomitans D7S-1]EKX98191.1 hypothetical protein HMPREF9996_00496 [Aggregatibacter actinomycetemcomitans Y4]KND85481.1 hypothetical protein H5P1_0203175 [Aggregatibacter actinomycetemcomitans serotype a str. H5P1]KOE30123.1 hypothetical protein D17P3_0311755 [Aggregatibacter actinomycetemcomitans D17P-3]KOE61787.1 hypothetical protein I63B_0311390 [Ag